MDPLFGLAVVKESSAMDVARKRNRTHEKILRRRISKIEEQCRSKTSKIHLVTKDVEKTFKDNNPPSGKSIVLPNGMSNIQKNKYLHIRRESLPSMSLEQFDGKLKDLKKRRDSTRNRDEQLHFENASTTMENTVTKRRVSIGPDLSDIDREIGCIVPELATNLNRRRFSQQKDVLKRANNENGIRDPLFTNISRFPPITDGKDRLYPLSKQTLENTPIPTGTTHKLFGDIRRRATMPDIHGIATHDLKATLNQNPDIALAKIDRLVDSWCSSPAVKRRENMG